MGCAEVLAYLKPAHENFYGVTTIETSPAFELLLCCARTPLSSETEERARVLLAGAMPWDSLVKLAEFHHLLPLLYRSLVQVDAQAMPQELFAFVQHRVRSYAIKNRFLTGELCRVLDLLAGHGVPALPLKGPALALAAYGDISLRQYGDLDLLIPPHTLDQVAEVLCREGYEAEPAFVKRRGLSRALFLHLGAQSSFMRGRNLFNLDVHTRIMPPLYPYAPLFDSLQKEAVALSLGPCSMPGLAPETMLQVLCYHGEKNRWETLKYVCDVAALIDAHPRLNWDAVVQVAREAKGLRTLLLGLYLAQALLGVPLPAGVVDLLEPERTLKTLGDELVSRLPGQISAGTLGYLARTRLHLALRDTWRSRLRYVGYATLRRFA